MSDTRQTPFTNSLDVTSEASRLRDYWELTKPRLSMMSVITAILGYFAAGPELSMVTFSGLVIGTTLSAFGAAALNQWWEKDADAKMVRTANRPCASGRVSPLAACLYGLALSIAGVWLLYATTTAGSSLLAAVTILLYILAYTPLKRMTPWATEMGAIPGAIPPLIGWLAAGGGLSEMSWILFAVLFVWQLPHFMAISWMCREDYAAGGFDMLSTRDPSGKTVSRKALIWTISLILVSLLPLIEAQIGWVLGVVAILLGWFHLKPAIRFVMESDKDPAAKKLFFATLIYLPVYLSALVVDRFFI